MNRSQRQPSVAVIGAGVTGLSAAFDLKQRGFRVALLERGQRTGGAIHTIAEHGYLVEAGPNALLLDDRSLLDLIERIGLGGELIEASPEAKQRFLVRRGKMLAAPRSLGEFVRTPLLTAGGKLRLLAEPFALSRERGQEESVAEFFRRRVGPEALDYAVNPFVGGVYAGDPQRLSMRHAFPRLHRFDQEYGSLLAGALASVFDRRRAGADRLRPRSVSFRAGLGALIEALERRLRAEISRSVDLVEVVPGPPFRIRFRQLDEAIQELEADALVIATPAHAAATLPLRGAQVALSPLSEVHYPPLASVALGFHRRDVTHALDGFGVLVPEREPFRVLGTLFSSTLFPGRAPADHVLLTTYVGGMRQPELARLPQPDLVSIVTDDLRRLSLVKGDPVYQRTTFHAHAIPQYHLGYERVQGALDALEQGFPGLFLGGPVRGGASVGDCFRAGMKLAARVAA